MLIGELSAKSGVSRDTIRYYQRLGLIGATPVSGHTNNYRHYTATDLRRLGMVRHAKALGFSLAEITAVISDWADDTLTAEEKTRRLQVKLLQVEEKARALDALRIGLLSALEKAGQPCDDSDEHPFPRR